MDDSRKYVYNQQKELANFGGIAALLGWDQMTYMPEKGAQDRSEQQALIARLAHERIIADEFYDHIIAFDSQKALLPQERTMVTRLRKDVEKARKIPASFVEKMSKTTTLAYPVWQEARNTNNFKLFAPHLSKIIELEKEYVDYINLPGHPYTSLLDDYEEGMTVEKLTSQFTILRSHLSEMLAKILASKRFEKQRPFTEKIAVDEQKKLCDFLLKKIGFPFDQARLDVSTHPFTTSMGYDDVRITTNFERDNSLFSFFSTIHEAGHAFYELGLPRDDQYRDTVISDAPSLGMHESQSRFWENMIARSTSFWMFFLPEFTRYVPKVFSPVNLDTWYATINQVTPSCIRVEADELTYCLHIILRFEMECKLIEGELSVPELPEYWNSLMHDLLGVRPSSDAEGVLQDMHWSTGEFGYFPTYALGTIYAAQLYQQLLRDYPETEQMITQGNFSMILIWLRDHIHRYGRSMVAEDIIKKVCGEGLNAQVFVEYLKNKYYQLYDL